MFKKMCSLYLFYFLPSIGIVGTGNQSLLNGLGVAGVLHKASALTASVCAAGVRAKFSKSSQCLSMVARVGQPAKKLTKAHPHMQTHPMTHTICRNSL